MIDPCQQPGISNYNRILCFSFIFIKLLPEINPMDTTFKLKIGMDEQGSLEQMSYTPVNFDFQIQSERIKTLTNQLKEKTGKFRLPTLIFDFPSSAKDINLQFFQSTEDTEYDMIQKNNRVYKCLDIINSGFTTMRKKFQKVFAKLTELNSKVFLHLDLYNVDTYEQRLKSKQDYAIVVFLEKAQIEGRVNLDPQFMEVLNELIAKISPKFADSPLMAVIPMFGGIDFELELDSLNQLEAKNQQQLFNFKNYQHPDDDEEGNKIKKHFNNKDKVFIYLTFGELGILKIELQVRMFAFYNCLA